MVVSGCPFFGDLAVGRLHVDATMADGGSPVVVCDESLDELLCGFLPLARLFATIQQL